MPIIGGGVGLISGTLRYLLEEARSNILPYVYKGEKFEYSSFSSLLVLL